MSLKVGREENKIWIMKDSIILKKEIKICVRLCVYGDSIGNGYEP